VGFAYGAAALYTVGVGSFRVAAGKHYVSDVATGALVGAAVGILVPRLISALN
jgi:membrane-associated phospholipid phosphatase